MLVWFSECILKRCQYILCAVVSCEESVAISNSGSEGDALTFLTSILHQALAHGAPIDFSLSSIEHPHPSANEAGF